MKKIVKLIILFITIITFAGCTIKDEGQMVINEDGSLKYGEVHFGCNYFDVDLAFSHFAPATIKQYVAPPKPTTPTIKTYTPPQVKIFDLDQL